MQRGYPDSKTWVATLDARSVESLAESLSESENKGNVINK
jgi:hypothetical protein